MKKIGVTISVIWIFMVSAANAEIQHKTTWVDGAAGHRCLAHLFFDSDAENLGLILNFHGNGIFAIKGHDLYGSIKPLVTEGVAAVVMIDKPGLRFSKIRSPKSYRRKYKESPLFITTKSDLGKSTGNVAVFPEFLRHTQADLVACGENAVTWAVAESKIGDETGVVFRGHSEGTEIITKIYEKMSSENSLLLPRIKALVFTGSVIFSRWTNHYTRQDFSENQKIKWRREMATKDDLSIVKEGGAPFGKAYFKEVYSLKHRSMAERLMELAQSKPATKFMFFHGIEDPVCVLSTLKDFEKMNSESKNPLRTSFRYYNTGHNLNQTAWADLLRLTRLVLIEQ